MKSLSIILAILVFVSCERKQIPQSSPKQADTNPGLQVIGESISDSLRYETAEAPPLPHMIHGYCPDEYGCDYTFAVATEKIDVFANAGDTTISFSLQVGDTAYYRQMNLHITQYRIVVFTSDYVVPYDSAFFSINDTLAVIHPLTEGFYRAGHNGEFLDLESCWDYPGDPAKTIVEPHSDIWMMIQSKQGHGWIRNGLDCTIPSHEGPNLHFNTAHPHVG